MSNESDEMRSHYDFSGGVRGKYAARYAEGAAVFPDSIAVNEALRTLVRISGNTVRAKKPRPRRSRE
jgi:hypothetical protein